MWWKEIVKGLCIFKIFEWSRNALLNGTLNNLGRISDEIRMEFGTDRGSADKDLEVTVLQIDKDLW